MQEIQSDRRITTFPRLPKDFFTLFFEKKSFFLNQLAEVLDDLKRQAFNGKYYTTVSV